MNRPPRQFVTGALLAGLLSGCGLFFGTPPPPAQPPPTHSAILPSPAPGSRTPPPSPTLAAVMLPPEGRTATVSEVVNFVEARPFADGLFQTVEDGLVIGIGGQVRTGVGSQARLDLHDGLIMRVGADTVLTLEAIAPGGDTPTTLVTFGLGQLWASVPLGWLQINTSLGPVSVRGSYARLELHLGDPQNAADDTLVVDCIQGACTAKTVSGEHNAFGLERLTFLQSGAQVVREPLTDLDRQSFIFVNPEAFAAVIATPSLPPPLTGTAVPPATATVAPALAAATATTTPPPTASANGVAVLGKHIVRPGETLFCIGRAYGVLPGAIAQANNLSLRGVLLQKRELLIPAVQWRNIPSGPVCAAQFTSPYPPGAGPQAAAPASPSAAATPVCVAPEIFDPAMNRCRIP